MNTIKNIEVSRKYGVSPTTVANWIEAAKKHKTNLQLIEKGAKSYILDTANNHLLMEKMTDDGKKHKNLDARRVLKPLPEFYKIFNENQISEIILGLENYNEILHKYTYLNKGATAWSQYVQRSFDQKIVNTVTNTTELINLAQHYILNSLDKDEKINIIDVGMGELSPIKGFLEQMVNQKILENYIGVDISPEMIEMAQENLDNWFGVNINYKFYLRDINKSSLEDVMFKLHDSKRLKTKNLIFFLETTIENQKYYTETLLNLKNSMGKDDLLIIMQSLNNSQSQLYFDLWNKEANKSLKLPDQVAWIPELLGLNEENYETVFEYNQQAKARFMKLKLNYETDLEFECQNLYKKIAFSKGSEIIVWRHTHHPLDELVKTYNDLGLEVQFVFNAKNQAQLIAGCVVSTK